MLYHADHTLSLTCATSQGHNGSSTVTQYHYLHWPEGGKPKGTASILKMAADLVKTQSSTGNKGITVMCKWEYSKRWRKSASLFQCFRFCKLQLIQDKVNCSKLKLDLLLVFNTQWWCGQDRCIRLHLFTAGEDQDCSNSWRFSMCQELSAPASWLGQDPGKNFYDCFTTKAKLFNTKMIVLQIPTTCKNRSM